MKKLVVSLVAPVCLIVSMTDVSARPYRTKDPDADSVTTHSRSHTARRYHRSYAARAIAQDDDEEYTERRRYRRSYVTRAALRENDDEFAERPRYRRRSEGGGGGLGGRPAAWCGWWMRTQFGGGPEYNLAWNWRNYGQPTSPQVGAIVVWRHHVGVITGQASNGQWIVKSGNDGGRVRERARSVAGAIFRI